MFDFFVLFLCAVILIEYLWFMFANIIINFFLLWVDLYVTLLLNDLNHNQ